MSSQTYRWERCGYVSGIYGQFMDHHCPPDSVYYNPSEEKRTDSEPCKIHMHLITISKVETWTQQEQIEVQY